MSAAPAALCHPGRCRQAAAKCDLENHLHESSSSKPSLPPPRSARNREPVSHCKNR
jgi:hypothetical protein